MPNDLSIQSRPPIHGTETPARTGAPTRENAPQSAKPVQPFTNPALRLEPALGLIVIEFHDDTGKLTSSIPNQRQIDAYRMHEETPPGQVAPKARDGETAAG